MSTTVYGIGHPFMICRHSAGKELKNKNFNLDSAHRNITIKNRWLRPASYVALFMRRTYYLIEFDTGVTLERCQVSDMSLQMYTAI